MTKPIWVDSWEEYWALKKLGKDNVHMKSKPTSGEYYIGPKGDICFNMTDEYDHQYTVRMDNPYNLNAEEATKLMRNINGCDKKEKEDD